MKESLNAAEAARVLNMPESWVRFYSPGWEYAKVRHVEGRQNKVYDIKTRKMCKDYDIPLEEAERRLAGNG